MKKYFCDKCKEEINSREYYSNYINIEYKDSTSTIYKRYCKGCINLVIDKIKEIIK